MVCGQSGLGKTTWIKSLEASCRLGGIPDSTTAVRPDNTLAGLEIFTATPDDLLTKFEIKAKNYMELDREFLIQDTPGYKTINFFLVKKR